MDQNIDGLKQRRRAVDETDKLIERRADLVSSDKPRLAFLGLRLEFLFLLDAVVVLGLQRQQTGLDVAQPLLGGVQRPLRLRQVLLSDAQSLALRSHRPGDEVVLVHGAHPLTDRRARLRHLHSTEHHMSCLTSLPTHNRLFRGRSSQAINCAGTDKENNNN